MTSLDNLRNQVAGNVPISTIECELEKVVDKRVQLIETLVKAFETQTLEQPHHSQLRDNLLSTKAQIEAYERLLGRQVDLL
jgi:sensor domain CHASE-containing protein